PKITPLSLHDALPILGRAGLRFGVAQAFVVNLVELAEAVEHLPAHIAIDAGRVVEIEDRVAAGTQRDARMLGGEEAGAPEAVGEDRKSTRLNSSHLVI